VLKGRSLTNVLDILPAETRAAIRSMRQAHKAKYSHYREDGKAFYRPPGHLNPIKREIVLRHPFAAVSFGEDTGFALNLLSTHALKTEEFVKSVLYIYHPSGDTSP